MTGGRAGTLLQRAAVLSDMRRRSVRRPLFELSGLRIQNGMITLMMPTSPSGEIWTLRWDSNGAERCRLSFCDDQHRTEKWLPSGKHGPQAS
jgi:hypothetical protein